MHEAGHAVAAHLLGVHVTRVALASHTAATVACTETSSPPPTACRGERPFWFDDRVVDAQQKRTVDNFLLVACAGRGAELVVYDDVDDDASADDVDVVRQTLLDSPLPLVPREHRRQVDIFVQSFIERRCDAAAELLEPHRRLLYAVARLLMQRGSIDAAEIHSLLNRVLIERHDDDFDW